MERIGYSLVDASGSEVWHIGEEKGQWFELPNAINLPNGDRVHGAKPGDTFQDWKLVERWIDDPQPEYHVSTGRTVAYDGEKIVVTVAYEATPSVPQPPTPVTPRQIRLALTQLGLRQAVEDFVAAQDITVKDSWEYSTQFERNHPLILGAAQALEKSEADIDALFALARSIS